MHGPRVERKREECAVVDESGQKTDVRTRACEGVGAKGRCDLPVK